MLEEIYTSGGYLEKNPGWHIEESFWKAKQIIRMIRKNHVRLADIRQERDAFFDLILVLDVIEHLENYFSFLRDIRPKK